MNDGQREAIEWAAQFASNHARPITGESLMQRREKALRALLADGGKGEAVTRYDLNGEFMKTSAYGEWVRFDDTAPQAECAPLPKQEPLGKPFQTVLDENRWYLYAECTPREAQPVFRCNDCGGFDIEQGPETMAPTPERANADPLEQFAKPVRSAADDYVPRVSLDERADAKKDAALTNEKIEAAIEAWFDTDGKDVDDHQSRMRAAILAANKEPERAQESYWQKAAETLERANVELSCAYVELKKKAIQACEEVQRRSGGEKYNMFGKDLAEQCIEAIRRHCKEPK